MTARRSILVGLLLLTAGLAGCIGSDEPADATETPSDQASEDDPASSNGTTDGPVQRTWTNETFEGQISGISAGGMSATQGDGMQTFTAEQGIEVLFLNLTAEGGAVEMTVGGPDCDVSGNAIPSCAETTSTSSGEASYTNETPVEGEWQVRLSVGDPAGAQVSYTLEVLQGIVAAGEA